MMGEPESISSSDDKSSSSSPSSNIRVVTRIRPLSKQERRISSASLSCLPGKQPLVQVVSNGENHAKENQTTSNNKRWFEFDAVLDESTTQRQVYERSGAERAVTVDLFRGYNTTILAYGQTGSGKTYTMGTANDDGTDPDDPTSRAGGIIPRACADLFATIRSKCDGQAVVTLSYLELYNEQIRDLFQPNDPSPGTKQQQTSSLRIRETLQGEVYVSGAVTHKVTNVQEVGEWMEYAAKQRVVASTAMNAVSSRSHAICTLHIEGIVEGNVKFSSKLTLVDLAGSERIKRTGAVGTRQTEGININKSLLVLGQVVSALSERKKPPYRDSKLTRLLQDSLGGNSRTILLACVSPASCNVEESVNTLRYASRARKIQNTATQNLVQDITAAEAAALKRENQLLHQQVAELQQTIRILTLSAKSNAEEQQKQHSSSVSPTNTVSTFVSDDDYPSADDDDHDEVGPLETSDQTDDNSTELLDDESLVEEGAEKDEGGGGEEEDSTLRSNTLDKTQLAPVKPLEIHADAAEYIIQISNLKVEVAQLKGELDENKFLAQRCADLQVQLAEVKAEADSARIAASYLSDIVDDVRSLKQDEVGRMHQLLQMKLKEQNMFSLMQAMLETYRMQVGRLSTDFEKGVVRTVNQMNCTEPTVVRSHNASDNDYDTIDDNLSMGSINSRSDVSKASIADLRSVGSFVDTTRSVGSFLYGRKGPTNRSWWKGDTKETVAMEPVMSWKDATTTFQSKIREIETNIGNEVESLTTSMSRLVEETTILENEIGNREIEYQSLLHTRDYDRKNQLVDHLSSMLVVKQASSHRE